MIYILVALQSEFDLIEDSDQYRVIYTRVGKVNAALTASYVCQFDDCDKIINYGTAGTLNSELTGKLIQVGTIYQRDMDARPLSSLGYTPFENTEFSGPITINDSKYSLSTGDNFVTSRPEIDTDLVDMEAYAIAKVCGLFNIPFECYKYVTDLADENAAQHWQENQHRGAELFRELL